MNKPKLLDKKMKIIHRLYKFFSIYKIIALSPPGKDWST